MEYIYKHLHQHFIDKRMIFNRKNDIWTLKRVCSPKNENSVIFTHPHEVLDPCDDISTVTHTHRTDSNNSECKTQ